MALLGAIHLLRLGVSGLLPPFCAIHFNHLCRESESDYDELLVRDFCLSHSIDFHSFPLEGLKNIPNFEASARRKRLQILSTLPYTFFLLGHHAGDQVENFFIRLFQSNPRHTRFTMRPIQKIGHQFLIRPLLAHLPEMIHPILQQEAIPFRIDTSNQLPITLRNRIRLGVIPTLRDLCPTSRQRILALLKRIEPEKELATPPLSLDPLTCSIASPNTGSFSRVPELIQFYVPGFRARSGLWKSIKSGLSEKRGQWQLEKDLVLTFYHQRLYLYRPSLLSPIPIPTLTPDQITRQFGSFEIRLECSSNLPPQLMLGEEVFPIPAEVLPHQIQCTSAREFTHKHRSLRKQFQNLRIPAHLRDQFPVIVVENRVLGIANKRKTWSLETSANPGCNGTLLLRIRQIRNFPCLVAQEVSDCHNSTLVSN